MPKQIITSQSAPTTGFTDKGTPSPLAQAIRAGNLLFVSGQGPLDPKTREVVSADIREQTKQTLANLKNVLAAARLDFTHVVNMRVVLRNTEDFAAFNETFREFMQGQNLIEHRPCPALLVDAFGRHVVHRFDRISRLGIRCVEGKNLCAAAPFLSARLVVLVEKKMLERSQQKGAKLALRAINSAQTVFLDQPRKERLRQVLGGLRRLPLSPDIGVQGKPIDLRQFFECPLPETVCIGSAPRQHDTPARCHQ